MEMPAMFKAESLARLGQGALVGAVATMIIGFNWGGWVLGQSNAHGIVSFPTELTTTSDKALYRNQIDEGVVAIEIVSGTNQWFTTMKNQIRILKDILNFESGLEAQDIKSPPGLNLLGQ